MNIFTKYLLVLFISFAATYLLVPFMRMWGWKTKLLAEPGGRRQHKKATPLTGGIAVFAGMHLACAFIFLFNSWGDIEGHMTLYWWGIMLAISTVLLLIGILDDKFELTPLVKLIGQIAVALTAYFAGIHIRMLLGVHLPVVPDMILTVLWFLGFMNAFNLIDGMDGLASGLGAISSAGMAAIFIYRGYPANTLVMFALLGSCLAFLRYNFFPATIFLGDSGSMFIGFVLAYVSLLTNSKSTTIATMAIPMLAIGVPILDTLLAIWRRSIRARLYKNSDVGKITAGDREHLHHRLAKRGLTQRKVVMGLYALNVAFVIIGICLTVFKSHTLGILLIAFIAGTYVLVKHLAYVEFKDSSNLLAAKLSQPVSRIVASVIYMPLDIIIMVLFSLVAVVIAHSQTPVSWNKIKHLWIDYIPLYVGIPFLVLCLGRTYKTVWSKARIIEYIRLSFELLAGIVLAFGLYSFVDNTHTRFDIQAMIVYAGLLIPVLVLSRAFLRIIHEMVYWFEVKEADAHSRMCRTLVIGTDKESVPYFTVNAQNSVGSADYIVAIIDDDSNLHNRYVRGIKVYGGLSDIRNVIKKKNIEKIVITIDLLPDRLSDILTIAKAHNISVVKIKMIAEEILS